MNQVLRKTILNAILYHIGLSRTLLLKDPLLTIEHRIEVGRHGGQDYSMGVDGVPAHLQANIAELKQRKGAKKSC